MNFKKIALASAVAMVPAMGYSQMVEMADTSMSDVTGQDGIKMDIVTPAAGIGANIYVHDKDGLGLTPPQTSYSFDGAIVIENFKFIGNVTVSVDAGDNAQAGNAPTMQVNVNIPTATIITGAIRVANSQRDDATPGWGINTQSATLLNTMTIAMSGLSMMIQLGNEPQGNMIKVSSTITGGLTMNGFALNDAGGTLTGGAIGSSVMFVKDTGAGTDLQLKVNADVTTAGLVLNLAQVGSTTGMDIRIVDQYFGTTTAGIVGDISIVGLNLNGTTVTVSGK